MTSDRTYWSLIELFMQSRVKKPSFLGECGKRVEQRLCANRLLQLIYNNDNTMTFCWSGCFKNSGTSQLYKVNSIMMYMICVCLIHVMMLDKYSNKDVENL